MDSLFDYSDLRVILEIGSGVNSTPAVTRFLIELFARNLGDCAKFCRVHQTGAEVPEDLSSVCRIENGVGGIEFPQRYSTSTQASPGNERHKFERSRNSSAKEQGTADLLVPNSHTLGFARQFGHFRWEKVSLSTCQEVE